ncbi:glycoside hydrolase family protein [Gilliamella apicola]|uniref:glycoside hydrolase family protein n=1 Tax=Gilliamella apicola TaxID=1196095 RepID=UPI003CC838B7
MNSFESLKLAAYKCQAGLYTIGYGHNKNVKYKDIISNSRADFLVQDIYLLSSQLVNWLK